MTATAEVTDESLSPADELIILGCDGLWDVMGEEDAYDLVKRKAKKDGAWDLAKCASVLVQAAYDNMSGDNISVLVMGLRRPRQGRRAPGQAQSNRPQVSPADLKVSVGADGTIRSVQLKQ